MLLRSFLASAALLAAACSPALADELFTLTSTSGTPTTITFTLPSSVTDTIDSPGVVAVNPVAVTINGITTANDGLFFLGAPSYGGLEIDTRNGYGTILVDDNSPQQLFGGTGGAYTFSPGGPYALTTTGVGTYTNNFSLSITSAATPEPSSIVLLGSGLLGVAGILRRRSARGAGVA